MTLQLQSVIAIPPRLFLPHEEVQHTSNQVKKPQIPFSTAALLGEASDDDSQDEEEMLISLKEDVESNSIKFYDATYEAIFTRLRAAVSCLDDDGLAFRQKKRMLNVAHAFCQAVLTSHERVPSLLSKHAQAFLEFLLETTLDCENEAYPPLLSPWFSLIAQHITGTAKRTLDNVITFLSEMMVGERRNNGLEHLLFHLGQFLDLCSEDVGNIQYFTQLITHILIPLYRLQCFYLSPKYKNRQSRNDRRPILLRSRLHKVLAFCVMKFPETSDAIIAGLFRLWECCRHLKVNPLDEEVEYVKAELKNTNNILSQYQANKVSYVKMKLTSSHERIILMKSKRRKDQVKRIHSLKQHLLLQIRSVSENNF